MSMKTIALLTGRGNNTLKDKNVIDILGYPVLHYPASSGRKARGVDDWYCSSNDKKILDAAEKEGYKRIVRPEELAKPTSQHIECILHALNVMEEQHNLPDILVVLLANNVTVSSDWITECVEMMKRDPELTAVVPVYKDNDHHPLRAKSLNPDGTLSMYEKGIVGEVSTNRQDLPVCYFLSHNFWVLRTSYVRHGSNGQPPWTFMGNKIMPYYIDESIDIHSISDLEAARIWIKEYYTD